MQGPGPGPRYGHVMSLVGQRFLLSISGNDGKLASLFFNRIVEELDKFLYLFSDRLLFGQGSGLSRMSGLWTQRPSRTSGGSWSPKAMVPPRACELDMYPEQSRVPFVCVNM